MTTTCPSCGREGAEYGRGNGLSYHKLCVPPVNATHARIGLIRLKVAGVVDDLFWQWFREQKNIRISLIDVPIKYHSRVLEKAYHPLNYGRLGSMW